MRLLRSIDELPAGLRGGAVAIGNFDGVHRGHARIVERLALKAKEVGGAAIVFTFDPHPVRLLRPDKAPPPLTWTDRKAELLAELGVDAMIAFPTDEALLSLSPEEFFSRIVIEKLAARAMVEGANFYFGRGRAGNIELLGRLCAAAGIRLEIVEPLTMSGAIVSSSRVRGLIQAGAVDAAREILTQPYRIRGMVTHGAARGARIGFPTANLDAIDTLLPAAGVYAGRALISSGRPPRAVTEEVVPAADDASESRGTRNPPPAIWPAAIHIGPNPTFGEKAVKVEAHLIGFHGSLYGEPIEVDFLSRLRGVQTFADAQSLRAQLERDVEAALAALRSLGPA
jgi:riboflavin kinase/FMN adenylyltransferase